jgi:tetratricopeptide (TPR) repeat protein/transcriptional regulator with XRE-family HTH domain
MGWRKQRELAEAINALGRGSRLDGNTISRWERGGHKPCEFHIELLCDIFAPLFVDSTLGNEMDRRTFIRKSLGFGATVVTGFAGVLPEAGFEQVPTKVDQRMVDGLEAITVNLERVEQQVGPVELIGPLTGHVHSMTARLRQASMSPSQRLRLCSIAAEAAGMLAMVKAEVGDELASAGYAKTAFRLCHEAGDQALGAWVMGCYTATQPAYRDNPQLRLQHFTEGAFGFSPRDASPRTRAWFATKAADVYGVLGRADDCLRSLDQAEAACQRATDEVEERPRHPLLGLDEFWLTSERGACLARLGQAEPAREDLNRALGLAGSKFNVKLWLELAMARTYVHDGEVEEACRRVQSVASGAQELNLDVLVKEVHRFHRTKLAPWATAAPVVSLGEQLVAI